MNKINVLLVEDDPFWKEHVGTCLQKEPDLCLVGTAETKIDAVRTTLILDIDVVLMDVILKGNVPDGIEAALEIGRMQKARVIMLTVMEQDEIVAEAFGNLACNYIFKTHIQDIPDAIRAAYINQSSIHFTSARALRNEVVRMKRNEWRRILTEAEFGILRLIEKGQSYSQITATLHIAESTMKKHVNRILKKLRVRSSKEAAKKAKMKGII